MNAAQQKATSLESAQTETRVGRRKFTAEYKQRIVAEAAACKRGELGLMLRREGLYSSTLDAWRKQQRSGKRIALEPRKRGRKPSSSKADDARLKRENERLQEELRQAKLIIEVQKKLCTLLGLTPAEEVP